MRALLDRTAPGFSVIIATRSKPTMPMGRIRARGGVMTIAGSDLCFDLQETSRLFRDAYHHPLDEDLVSDLHDRTEGWAALLTLVRTSLEEQDDPRALVEHLDASRGDLYDFLAEEVLATPSCRAPALPDAGCRIDGGRCRDGHAGRRAIGRGRRRVHPRVGPPGPPVAPGPRVTAPLPPAGSRLPGRAPRRPRSARKPSGSFIGLSRARLVTRDWHAAAWHFMMARDPSRCAQVVDSAVDEVIAAGRFEQVKPFLVVEAGDPDRPLPLC